MKKDQVQREGYAWRGDRGDRDSDMCDVTGRSDEQMQNAEACDRQRAEYFRLHDDDEAELDLPR
jgi:hypothetical protein